MEPRQRTPLVTCTPVALVLVLLVLVSILAWDRIGGAFTRSTHVDADPRPIAARGDLAADERATIELFERCSPSVVHITTTRLARRSFSFSALEMPVGTGSGYVWDERGYVVTNAHVIADASKAYVTLTDNSEWSASLVGAAPEYDIAVLQIDATRAQMPPILVGTSKDLRVGQKVFAIGNPFGLDHTLTTGIISALGRDILGANRVQLKGMIQTDAAINPGNSGGPLLDSAGRLIGMNTAIYTETGSNVGIGFALPVDVVNAVVPQLIRNGRVVPPIIGVREAPDQVKRMLGVDGVVIASVEPGSGADKAGVRSLEQEEDGSIAADVILSVAGEKVSNLTDVRQVLVKYRPGDAVDLELLRGKEKKTVSVVLQGR
ncbi:MAG: trypsin-like peptidase domain-containing protein [Planctomycetes bacterium]|nr:trypsin-like peptidase domain-containing protein [Planctomycetota bacterium]